MWQLYGDPAPLACDNIIAVKQKYSLSPLFEIGKLLLQFFKNLLIVLNFNRSVLLCMMSFLIAIAFLKSKNNIKGKSKNEHLAKNGTSIAFSSCTSKRKFNKGFDIKQLELPHTIRIPFRFANLWSVTFVEIHAFGVLLPLRPPLGVKYFVLDPRLWP